MKKPNITEGEWKVEKPSITKHYAVMQGDVFVAGGLTKDDAQAISAVPEMLQSLYDWVANMEMLFEEGAFKHWKEYERQILEEMIEDSKRSLKKAGVEL